MKAIVFISTQKSGSSREAIKAAEQLGYFTVLFTDRKSFIDSRTEFPDVHLMQLCNLEDIGEIRHHIRRLILRAIDICAIVSFVDPYCHTACLLAEEFKVNWFSTQAVGNMQSKILSHEALSGSPYGTRFLSLNEGDPVSRDVINPWLPLIIKSPNSSGSKDVYRINTWTDFKRQLKELFKKYPGVPVLVEEFLDGPQYLVETVVCNDEVNIMAVISQEITYANEHYIVTGYNLLTDPPKLFYSELKKAVKKIIKLHGMFIGTCHLELRYVKNQWKLIEINPRISGGGMNKFIEAGYGINLVKETLKLALGQVPDLSPKYIKHTYAKYYITSQEGILEKVTGRNKALRCPGIKEVYIKPRKGTLLVPPVSMGNRYAYVIASGDSGQEAENNAVNALSQINFVLKNPKTVTVNETDAEDTANTNNESDAFVKENNDLDKK